MEVVLRPAEVIVSFRKDGTVRPVRFRVINDDSGYETINVERVLRMHQEKVGRDTHNIFTCKGVVNLRERLFELKFDEAMNSWTLYRM